MARRITAQNYAGVEAHGGARGRDRRRREAHILPPQTQEESTLYWGTLEAAMGVFYVTGRLIGPLTAKAAPAVLLEVREFMRKGWVELARLHARLQSQHPELFGNSGVSDGQER